MKYDVIIVGAGPAGYFLAYELINLRPETKILLLEKGRSIYERNCPVKEGKINKCPVNINGESGCYPSCSITNGFGGAGAFSDGKFNITSEFGGWMTEYLSEDEVLNLINYVDQINLSYGATKTISDPDTDIVKQIERRAIGVGLKLLRAKVRHLGTEENLNILKSIYEDLKNKITFMFNSQVTDIITQNQKISGVKVEQETYLGDFVFLAVGRDGSKWLNEICFNNDIEVSNNQVDIGVRVETSDVVMEEINKHLYEGKFIYRTSQGTTVRTFCSNPSGHVVIENDSGTILANGHSYNDLKLGSKNTNFALLVSHRFSEPFHHPNEYAIEISKLANKLSIGSVIIQRYGDFKNGRRSNQKRIQNGFIIPTLKEAVPGDLGLVLPYKTMTSIVEMIEALDHVTPGIANEHTLFYGVEAKFYSARPKTNSEFETSINNLFVGGDGAGITRGLAQAGANGIYVARVINNRLKNNT